ncbi:MAG: barstar family protein [Actinomycetota bacterium]|nr:barstar family protein [Actinomycetota bacterium]
MPFEAFAKFWDFPPWFGRNHAAFDDFMRDLDNMTNKAALHD